MDDYDNLLYGGITTRAQRRASQNQRPQTSMLKESRSLRATSSNETTDTDSPEPRGPEHEAKIANLAENPDYIALQSTLSLLTAQKGTAVEDIQKLHSLKTQALEDPEKFLSNLQGSRSLEGAPRPQDVAKVPIIPWKSYGISNPGFDEKLKQGLVEPSASFGAVRLFNESLGDRNRFDR